MVVHVQFQRVDASGHVGNRQRADQARMALNRTVSRVAWPIGRGSEDVHQSVENLSGLAARRQAPPRDAFSVSSAHARGIVASVAAIVSARPGMQSESPECVLAAAR
jgi:hypothetical protein